MNSKKGMTNQVFIYAGSLIVVIVVLYFGWISVANISEKSCQVSHIDLAKDLESYLLQYRRLGRLENEIIPLPCQTQTLCFVDIRAYNSTANGEAVLEFNPGLQPIIIDAIESFAGESEGRPVVFRIAADNQTGSSIVFDTDVRLSSEDFDPSKSVWCVQDPGDRKVEVKFSGKGKYAVVGDFQ